jgi:hypothetical protein
LIEVTHVENRTRNEIRRIIAEGVFVRVGGETLSSTPVGVRVAVPASVPTARSVDR